MLARLETDRVQLRAQDPELQAELRAVQRGPVFVGLPGLPAGVEVLRCFREAP